MRELNSEQLITEIIKVRCTQKRSPGRLGLMGELMRAWEGQEDFLQEVTFHLNSENEYD